MITGSACLLVCWLSLCSAQKSLVSVYVYELPANLTDGVINGHYQERWLNVNSYEWEADLWLHWQITQSPARTWDPAAADLFYIPILPTRLLHQSLSPKCSWYPAVNKSAEYIREALTIVQQQPYWAKYNGRDHFFCVTADEARCASLTMLPRTLWGDISIVHHTGDVVMRQHGRPCYDPDTDILLPGNMAQDTMPIVPAVGRNRTISVLYAFGTTGNSANHKYHSRLIKPELRKQFEAAPIASARWLERSINVTLQDMANSIFCVCPPGIVANTSRFWKAIRRGCIPVTFFRGFDLPFASAIDYGSAIVNIQPDNLDNLPVILTNILNNPDELLALQKSVDHIQSFFLPEPDVHSVGTAHMFWQELARRSAHLYSYAVSQTYDAKGHHHARP